DAVGLGKRDGSTARAMRRRSVIAAAAGAVCFAAAAWLHNADLLALARLALCGAALGAVVRTDLVQRRIPNRVVVPAAVVCAALSAVDRVSVAVLTAGLAVVAVLLVLSLARPAALGMGDVKLALLLVVGLDGTAPRALLIGLALAAAVGLALLLA